MSKRECWLGDRVRVRFGARLVGVIFDKRSAITMNGATLMGATYRVRYDDGDESGWLRAVELEPIDQQGEGAG